MNKFQLKLTRFAHLAVEKEKFGTLMFFLMLFSLIVVAGLCVLLYEKLECLIYLIVVFSPFYVIALVGSVCKWIDEWAYGVFFRNFGFPPTLNRDIEMLGRLKELALELEKAFEESETIEDLNERSSFTRIAKDRFWSMWNLAKAFGFPVFCHWHTHAHTTIR